PYEPSIFFRFYVNFTKSGFSFSTINGCRKKICSLPYDKFPISLVCPEESIFTVLPITGFLRFFSSALRNPEDQNQEQHCNHHPSDQKHRISLCLSLRCKHIPVTLQVDHCDQKRDSVCNITAD